MAAARDYIEIYPQEATVGSRRGWRSRFVRSNGEIMATGAERYESVQACAQAAQHVFGLPRAARAVSAWKRQRNTSLRWYR